MEFINSKHSQQGTPPDNMAYTLCTHMHCVHIHRASQPCLHISVYTYAVSVHTCTQYHNTNLYPFQQPLYSFSGATSEPSYKHNHSPSPETHSGCKQQCSTHDDRCSCEHQSDRSHSKHHWSWSRSRKRSHDSGSHHRSPYRSHDKSPNVGLKSSNLSDDSDSFEANI
jgi:hypothetical protein